MKGGWVGGDHSPQGTTDWEEAMAVQTLRNKKPSNTSAFAVGRSCCGASWVVTRTFFQSGLGHRGQRGFMQARCYSVAGLSAWSRFGFLLFLTGLILPGWVGALASALFSCVLHYLWWLPGALWGFLAGSPIVVKLLHCAKLGSGGEEPSA